jgi:hypothetical protein
MAASLNGDRSRASGRRRERPVLDRPVACDRQHGDVAEQRRAYKGDLPGSRSGPCLGCGQRVVTARHAHVLFGGKRDGSLLVAWDTEPQRSYATDVDRIYIEPDLFLLGVAHRTCAPLARRRLEAQEVELPDELPTVLVDEEVDDLPALHLPPTGGFCAFCGGADASDEHVFPKWVSEELNKLAPMEMTTDYGKRSVRSLDMTARICSTCNNRWLSVLENDVRTVLAPLIRGHERTLTVDEQRRLAAWATKTALMLDLASGAAVIPSGFYYEFRQLRMPLPSHLVWLGAYLGNKKAVWAERRGLHVGIGEDELPNGFVTTFSVFRVVFQIVGHFTVGGATFDESRLLNAALAPIWPPPGEVLDWPRRGLAFGDEALAELAGSIAGSSRG